MENKTIRIIAASLVSLGIAACATPQISKVTEPSTGRTIEISKFTNFNNAPKSGLAQKKIYFSVKESPKGSEILQNELKKRGFQIVDTPEQAEVAYELDGMIIVDGKGMKRTNTRLGIMMERSIREPDLKKAGYHQTDGSDVRAMLVSKALTGAFDPFSVVKWFSDLSGLSAGLNTLLTGDPKGACIGKNCDKYFNIVNLVVRSKDGYWTARGQAMDERLVIDTMLTDLIDTAMKPIYDQAPNAPKQATTTSAPQ